MTDRTPIDEAIEWAEDALKYEQEEMAGNKYDQSERYLIVLCALREYKASHDAALSSQPAHNPWKEAVIDEAVIAFAPCEFEIKSPRQLIKSVIEANVRMTLDPQVSETAQALYDKGFSAGSRSVEVDSRSRLKRVAIQRGEPVPTFAAVGDEMTPTDELTDACERKQFEAWYDMEAHKASAHIEYPDDKQKSILWGVWKVAADRALRADGWVTVPREPEPERIEAGAERLAKFEADSVWPNSFDSLDVRQMRLEAGKVYRSMVNFVAPKEPT